MSYQPHLRQPTCTVFFNHVVLFFNSLNASCSLPMPGFCPGCSHCLEHFSPKVTIPSSILLDNFDSSFRYHISLNVILPGWLPGSQIPSQVHSLIRCSRAPCAFPTAGLTTSHCYCLFNCPSSPPYRKHEEERTFVGLAISAVLSITCNRSE